MRNREEIPRRSNIVGHLQGQDHHLLTEGESHMVIKVTDGLDPDLEADIIKQIESIDHTTLSPKKRENQMKEVTGMWKGNITTNKGGQIGSGEATVTKVGEAGAETDKMEVPVPEEQSWSSLETKTSNLESALVHHRAPNL
uniref:Uncharacterized protein n=1 Tax=Arion vulgaris TaxID=1028688 RepID=A0A0B6ZVE1_9EUPU